MALKIERGKRVGAHRVVIAGTDGIGKTTLAAAFPSPLILDTEDGSGHLDTARVTCHSWDDLMNAVMSLGGDPQGFETVVIDTVDWGEKALIEHVVRKGGKRSIEDFGFGKGWIIAAEQFSKLLDALDSVIRRGVHVVLVCHTTVKRVSPPDMTDGFDRYELKLSKQVSPLVREWCDVHLFCTTKVRLVEGNDGRTKASGGKVRVMHSERTAAWDAKNRLGLPEEMPMTIDALAPLFAAAKPAEPAKKKAWKPLIDAAQTLEELHSIAQRADAAGEPEDVLRKIAFAIAKRAAVIVIEPEFVVDDTATEPFDSAEVGAEANQ